MSAAAQPFSFPVRVYYEDTDAAGVVYYANYLRFMERARSEWLSSLGVEVDVLAREHRVAFAVHRLDIEYVRPGRLGDRLDVGVTLREAGRASIALEQRVTRDGEDLTRARVVLACLDHGAWRPARIPAELLERLPRPS